MPGLSLKHGFRKSVVIVEIGNDWLKVVAGDPSFKGGMVTQACFKKLVDIKESVTDALARIFKELKLNKQGVTACIPRHLVTVRLLEFPSINPRDIGDMISLQVGKQTPYSREEIIYTYKMVSVAKEGYTKVMLVIARRNLVNARVEVLQKAGIEVEKVAMSSEGLFHWAGLAHCLEAVPGQATDEGKGDDQAIVVVDIDSNYSDCIVIRNGKLVYTRNFLIGANHLLGEGERWKDKFAEEIAHSLGLYQNEERDAKIIKMFISGAAPFISGLNVFLASKTGMFIEIAEPARHIPVHKGLQAFRGEECRFISPCPLIGMSFRSGALEFDLTSSALRIKKQIEEGRRRMTFTGILALSIVTMMSILFFMVYYNKNSYLIELKRAIARNAQDAQEVERMRMSIDLVKGRLDARKRSINVLYEIMRLTPGEIYFTHINIEEKNNVVLQGRAAAMSNVFEYVTAMEGSSYFENVKTTYTTTKKDKDMEYAKFEIIGLYEKDNDDAAPQ
jgi:Tfp pilus assembly PilM family ATPase